MWPLLLFTVLINTYTFTGYLDDKYIHIQYIYVSRTRHVTSRYTINTSQNSTVFPSIIITNSTNKNKSTDWSSDRRVAVQQFVIRMNILCRIALFTQKQEVSRDWLSKFAFHQIVLYRQCYNLTTQHFRVKRRSYNQQRKSSTADGVVMTYSIH